MFAKDILKGRTAFITGGGTGIGFEIAKKYVSLGANVMIVGRNEERLAEACTSINSEITAQAKALFTKVDVRNYEEVENSIINTTKQFGSLDILVNNAAGNFVCPTADISPNGWKTIIDIDLNGTFYCCKAAYPYLKSSKFGASVLSMTTMLGISGWPSAAPAASAKAGIISLSRTLAVEWGNDNIRVNTISPGPIGDTEGVRRMYIENGKGDLEVKKTALGRFGKKDDIANAAIFLASDLSSYITGDNLVVDGGRWLKYVAE